MSGQFISASKRLNKLILEGLYISDDVKISIDKISKRNLGWLV
jgi:hypothetical protein